MICDPDYRLVWVSDELKALIGEQDERKLGIGEHIATAWLSETWNSKVTLESELRSFMEAGPYLLARAGGGREDLKRLAPQLSDLIVSSSRPNRHGYTSRFSISCRATCHR